MLEGKFSEKRKYQKKVMDQHVRTIEYMLSEDKKYSYKICENSKYQPGHGSILWVNFIYLFIIIFLLMNF